MTATEKIYIHGAIGDSVGYQVIDLKTGLSTQDDNDRLIISDFDKSLVIKYAGEEKKISELFKVKRKGNRGYYTYIRYNLSGTRPGCSLGFTFVYENGGAMVTEYKKLRNCMKKSLESLLNGKAIILKSFSDPKLTVCYNQIKECTNKVNANKIPLPQTPKAYPIKNPQDVTDEEFFAILQNAEEIFISEDVVTEMAKKDAEIQKLKIGSQTTIKTLDGLRKENQRLENDNRQKDKTIDGLNDEKKKLQDKIDVLSEDNKKKNSEAVTKLEEIGKEFDRLKAMLGGGKVERVSNKESKSSIKEQFLSWVNTILLIVILFVLLFVKTCGSSGKADTDTGTQTLSEVTGEYYEESDVDREELESKVERLTFENDSLYNVINNLQKQLENAQKKSEQEKAKSPTIKSKDKNQKKKENSTTKKQEQKAEASSSEVSPNELSTAGSK